MLRVMAAVRGSPAMCFPLWTASKRKRDRNRLGWYRLRPRSPRGHLRRDRRIRRQRLQGVLWITKVCTPLWEYAKYYPVVDGYAADSGTTLYLDTFYSPAPRQFEGDTEAFDANGSSGCSGMPTLCTPRWSSGYYSLNAAPLAGVGARPSRPHPGDFGIAALGTGGSLKWNTTPANNLKALAIGGLVLYASDGTDVYAFDAGGSTGCSGSPVTCASRWSALGTNAIVANGTLYVSTTGNFGATGRPPRTACRRTLVGVPIA